MSSRSVDLRRSVKRDEQLLARAPRRPLRSPIGVYGLATRARVPQDTLYYAVVALATVRGDWLDDGAALGGASVLQLSGARRLLETVAGDRAVVAQLTAAVLAETVAAARLLAGERLRRERPMSPER